VGFTMEKCVKPIEFIATAKVLVENRAGSAKNAGLWTAYEHLTNAEVKCEHNYCKCRTSEHIQIFEGQSHPYYWRLKRDWTCDRNRNGATRCECSSELHRQA